MQDLWRKDVVEVFPAEGLDPVSLTWQQASDLCPMGAAEVKSHEHRCQALTLAEG
jgi:hypothetical protein